MVFIKNITLVKVSKAPKLSKAEQNSIFLDLGKVKVERLSRKNTTPSHVFRNSDRKFTRSEGRLLYLKEKIKSLVKEAQCWGKLKKFFIRPKAEEVIHQTRTLEKNTEENLHKRRG